ncbi:MAG: D-2-hydroxyacid dehydrogenase [Alphaproteobacteria bacterium]|nr:D-2-hydroxyacid dehydrogenase [Alphaproteobacteria bacterium]
MHIVHLDRATIGPDVSLTKPAAPHDWVSHDRTAPDEVVPRLKDADVAIVNKIALRAGDIAQLPRLKMIAIAATGYDKIDLEACRARGIVVSNIRGYARHTVPEHTFALMLALRRGIKGYSEDVTRGEWQRSERFCLFTHPVADLNGATLGLIGTGTIGGAVGRIAEAFGMTVLKAGRKGDSAPPPGRTGFDEVIERADVISLHCPLTPETRGLIAAPEFARMKPSAIVINTSRGGLVDETDLITALDDGLIAGAGFDVVTTEPPAEDHIFMKNLDRPNFILTPHTAWASNEAMQVLWDQLIGHIDAFADGTPTHNLTSL